MSIYNESGDMIEFIPDYTYHIPDWLGLTTHIVHDIAYNDHIFNDCYINPKIQERNKSAASTIDGLAKKIHISVRVLEMILGSYDGETIAITGLNSFFNICAFYGDLIKAVLKKDKWAKRKYMRSKTRRKILEKYKEFLRLKKKIGKQKAAKAMIKKYLTKQENCSNI